MRKEALRRRNVELHRQGGGPDHQQRHQPGRPHGEPERACVSAPRHGRRSQAAAPCARALEAARRSSASLSSDTIVETTIANTSVIENSWNSRPASPPRNSSGMKAAISDTRIAITVKPISPRARERRLHRGHAPLEIAVGVLDHDDGVVDHEADRDRERHQRQVVDREAERPHPRERAGERERHGDAGREGRREPLAGRRTRPASPARSRSAACICMSATLARIVVVRSASTVTSMPAGIQREISGSSAFTPSTVSMTFAAGCLVTLTSTAGLPLKKPERL